MGIVSKGNIEDKLRLAFDIYDTNDDGMGWFIFVAAILNKLIRFH